MFEVVLYSFLASFFLILLGTGIYIRYREKINQFPVKEKIIGLKNNFQKYRYWYLAVTVIVLAPILYYSLDSIFNPSRFKPPPELHVPPPQPVKNEDDSYLFYFVTEFFRISSPIITIAGFCFVSLLLILGPWIFKFNKNSFLFQSLAGITSSILFIPSILYIVLTIFFVIFFLSIL